MSVGTEPETPMAGLFHDPPRDQQSYHHRVDLNVTQVPCRQYPFLIAPSLERTVFPKPPGTKRSPGDGGKQTDSQTVQNRIFERRPTIFILLTSAPR